MNRFDNQEPELADLKAVMALMEHGTVTRAVFHQCHDSFQVRKLGFLVIKFIHNLYPMNDLSNYPADA